MPTERLGACSPEASILRLLISGSIGRTFPASLLHANVAQNSLDTWGAVRYTSLQTQDGQTYRIPASSISSQMQASYKRQTVSASLTLRTKLQCYEIQYQKVF